MALRRIDFRQGLNEFYETSVTPDGHAPELANWVPEPNGALRVDRGWQNASATGLSGAKEARGLGNYVDGATQMVVVAVKKDADEYSIWEVARSSLAAGTWAKIQDWITSTPNNHVAFTTGDGVLLYSAIGVTNSRIRYFNGTTAGDANTAAIAGRGLAYHLNRFFSCGDAANPTYLRWSELGDYTTWTVGTNFQPIGDADGEPLEALCSWDRLLWVGKENAIWYVSGSGPTSFAFRQADGGGCAPGKTLVPTPDGVVAIGRERVYMLTGGGFDPISRAIENSYGMTGDFMSGAYIDGRVHINDNGSGTTWVFDLESGTWTTVTVSSASEGPGYLHSAGPYLLAGTKNASTNSVALYREEPGGARERADGTAQAYHAATPDFWPGEGINPLEAIDVYVQYRQRGTTGTTPLTITMIATKQDGTETSSAETIAVKATAGAYRTSIRYPISGRYNYRLEFDHAPTTSETVTFDIEAINVEEHMLERRKGQQ